MKPLGLRGEDLAADYLKKKGCTILQRNYRTPLGEADIIASDRGTLVFVEVKARANDAYGQPFEAVGRIKQAKLRRVALYYMKHNKLELPVRFDVISIMSKNGRDEINHIKEAF